MRSMRGVEHNVRGMRDIDDRWSSEKSPFTGATAGWQELELGRSSWGWSRASGPAAIPPFPIAGQSLAPSQAFTDATVSWVLGYLHFPMSATPTSSRVFPSRDVASLAELLIEARKIQQTIQRSSQRIRNSTVMYRK